MHFELPVSQLPRLDSLALSEAGICIRHELVATLTSVGSFARRIRVVQPLALQVLHCKVPLVLAETGLGARLGDAHDAVEKEDIHEALVGLETTQAPGALGCKLGLLIVVLTAVSIA